LPVDVEKACRPRSPRSGKIPPEVAIDRGAGSIANASRLYEAGGPSINEIIVAASRLALSAWRSASAGHQMAHQEQDRLRSPQL